MGRPYSLRRGLTVGDRTGTHAVNAGMDALHVGFAKTVAVVVANVVVVEEEVGLVENLEHIEVDLVLEAVVGPVMEIVQNV